MARCGLAFMSTTHRALFPCSTVRAQPPRRSPTVGPHHGRCEWSPTAPAATWRSTAVLVAQPSGAQRLAVDVYVTVFGVLHDFVDRPGRAAQWTLADRHP